MKKKYQVNYVSQKVDKEQDETPICAFDMETRGLGGDFLICAFMASDGVRACTYTLADTFLWMVEHPAYRYLAHNGSGYEFAYLYQFIYEYFLQNEDIEITPILQGENRIVSFQLTKEGKRYLDIRDTLCLFNMPLVKVAQAFCPELPKGEPGWNEDYTNFDIHSAEWMDYLWRDCEIIVIAYQSLRDMVWKQFHTNLGITAGRVAMNAWQATIPEKEKYWRVGKKKEDFFRKAYYGGAVFPGHATGNWGSITSLDINAAYGYQMGTHEFPTSTPAHTCLFHDGLRGIYRVLGSVPEQLYDELGFNPLPLRTPHGLLWPSGTFETYVTDIEITYARSVGCTVEILEGYVWFECKPVFADFIRKCEQLELDGDGCYKPMVKLLRNSLYGKFGTKEMHSTLVYSHEGFPEARCVPMLNKDTGREIEGVYVGEEETNAPYILPHWACFITAFQRIYLFGFIAKCYALGASTVYCDTDSIKCSSSVVEQLVDQQIVPIGKRYGQFKVEETCEEFIVLGPKCFYGKEISQNGTEGKELKKAKGIRTSSLSRDSYTDAVRGTRNKHQFASVNSVLSLLKRREHTIGCVRERVISDIRNSGTWREVNGKILPQPLPTNSNIFT